MHTLKISQKIGAENNGYWFMYSFITEQGATSVLLVKNQDDTGTERNTIIQQIISGTLNRTISNAWNSKRHYR